MDHTIVASARRASPFNTQTSIALPAEEDVMKMSEFYYNPQLQQIIQCLIFCLGPQKAAPFTPSRLKMGVCVRLSQTLRYRLSEFHEHMTVLP